MQLTFNNIQCTPASVLAQQFYCTQEQTMIKSKYKNDEVIKSKGGKVVESAIHQNGQRYVLKSYPTSDSSSIDHELEVYQKIKQPHLHGIPEVKEGFKSDGRLYLVFDQLGPNLEYLRLRCGGRFSLKSTLMVGLQMLERIEFIHENGFLHGDIKPSNFLIGSTNKMKHKVYLVDFELSRAYLANGKHIEEETIDNFSGCLRFCSSSYNNRRSLCRRDELQSLIYTLVYLVKGELPWMNVIASDMSEAYTITGSLKLSKKGELLQGLPETFKSIMNYIESVKFKEKPNYGYLRAELLGLMKKNGYELDYKYDWEYL